MRMVCTVARSLIASRARRITTPGHRARAGELAAIAVIDAQNAETALVSLAAERASYEARPGLAKRSKPGEPNSEDVADAACIFVFCSPSPPRLHAEDHASCGKNA